MDKFIDPDLLKDNAESVEEMDYTKQLTEEELIEIKDKLADVSIKEYKMLDKEKERRDGFKAEITPVQLDKRVCLTEINTGVRDYYGKLYLLADQEDGKMGYYDEKGFLVKDRILAQDEKQLRIDYKSGTNN